MVDIDDFKNVNDNYGHPIGDDVIAHVAKTICESTRESDLVSRYGGDEFAVILPETSAEIAATMAERLRQTIERLRFPSNSQEARVTVSIGVGYYRPGADTASEADLIAAADKALYRSKSQGKNRVTLMNDL
jgi:two-component system cell cycle response regulator